MFYTPYYFKNNNKIRGYKNVLKDFVILFPWRPFVIWVHLYSLNQSFLSSYLWPPIDRHRRYRKYLNIKSSFYFIINSYNLHSTRLVKFTCMSHPHSYRLNHLVSSGESSLVIIFVFVIINGNSIETCEFSSI